jgi:hypothetical protein
MSPQDDDPDLQRLFAARRRRDESGAPPFQRVLRPVFQRAAREGKRRRRRTALRPAIAVALCALCLLAVWAARRWRGPLGVPGATLPTLEAWRAPTDFLLAVPGKAILDSTPSLSDSRLPAAPNPNRPSGS